MLCSFIIEIAAVVWRLFIHCCVSDLSVEITKEEMKYHGASNLHNFLKCSLERRKHCFFPIIEINKYNTQSVNISAAAAVLKNISIIHESGRVKKVYSVIPYTWFSPCMSFHEIYKAWSLSVTLYTARLVLVFIFNYSKDYILVFLQFLCV